MSNYRQIQLDKLARNIEAMREALKDGSTPEMDFHMAAINLMVSAEWALSSMRDDERQRAACVVTSMDGERVGIGADIDFALDRIINGEYREHQLRDAA